MGAGMKKNISHSKYHHGDLRNALLTATLSLIEEKGLTAFTVREVAKRAGVSHAAPYRHFKDKDDLLFEVAIEGFSLMVSETKKRSEKHRGNPLARFQVCGLSYIDFATSHPSHYRAMFFSGENKEKYPEALVASFDESFRLLRDIILECQEKGLIKTGDTNDFALAAWSIVHGYAKLCIDGFINTKPGLFSNQKGLKYIITESLYAGLRPKASDKATNEVKNER